MNHFTLKKFLIILAFVFPVQLNAQGVLHFDKHFVESEDRWVAFKPEKDSAYAFGFIYIDEQAGLTLNYEGTFKIMPSGEFVAHKIDSVNWKVRLEPNNVLVAFIPENKFHELDIPAIPGWLKYYKTDSNSVARLYKWGYMYNGWDECEKALTYLKRAEKIDPNFKGLRVELAYSYNSLGQYDQAIHILTDALKIDSADAYVNKELIYAQIKSGKLENAAKSYRKALAICRDQSYNGENCYNLLHNYFLIKDKEDFNLWLKDAKKWNANNEKIMQSIAAMDNEMNP